MAIATVAVWLISLWLIVDALRRPGLVRTPRRLAAAAASACVGVLLTSALLFFRFFAAFSGETLVATVTTRRLSPIAFELTYTPAPPAASPSAGRRTAVFRRVQLEGDQWTLSGGIVKWHPWLTALGLKSYHKPMRLGGQFSNLEQQRAHLPTVYPIEPTIDRFWEALYWADPYLPFVEAVYGSSAYVYVEPGAVQEVYVTLSGYLIKRAAF